MFGMKDMPEKQLADILRDRLEKYANLKNWFPTVQRGRYVLRDPGALRYIITRRIEPNDN